MSGEHHPSPAERAVRLAHEFLTRVWGPAHDLEAIDDLMTDNYRVTTGGVAIEGRAAFKAWVSGFQRLLLDARTVPVESFADAGGTRVVSRWTCTGRNNGIFGLPPDGRPVRFTGIAIWVIRDDRLAESWVERAALEAYRDLAREGAGPATR